MADECIFDFKLDTNHLIRSFDTDDHIGSVLRSAFLVEECVNYCLAKNFEDTSKIVKFGLAQKIHLLQAVGLPSDYIGGLNKIKDIRNKIAHEGLEEIPEKELGDLFSVVKNCTQGRFSCEIAVRFDNSTEIYKDMAANKQLSVLAAVVISYLSACVTGKKRCWISDLTPSL